MRAKTQSTPAKFIQRASFAIALFFMLLRAGNAQRTTTVYATTPYQQSTNWWSSLFNSPSGSAGPGLAKNTSRGTRCFYDTTPAVARIIVPERKSAALGSGTLIAKTALHGYLITNWHVVREARNGALVVFANGTQARAEL